MLYISRVDQFSINKDEATPVDQRYMDTNIPDCIFLRVWLVTFLFTRTVFIVFFLLWF